MNKINVKLLWIAAGISLICTFLFYQYLSSLEKADEDKRYTTVVVAKENIEPNSKIIKNMIEEKKIAIDNTTLNINIKTGDIVGKYVKDTILKGENIRTERLVDENDKSLAMKIPENKRAVSILVDEYMAVGDMIEPGNYVDIYVNLDEKTIENMAGKVYYSNQTKMLLQNIQVLAISKKQIIEDKERDKVPNKYSITLAATAFDTEKLIYAENYGTIKLALRPINDNGVQIVYGINEDNLRN